MKGFFALFLFIVALNAKGQDTTLNPFVSHSLYIEGLGAGLRFSANYDAAFRLPIKNLLVAGDVGIAPNIWNPKYLYFPLKIYVLYGKKNSYGSLGVNFIVGLHWTQSFLHPEDYILGNDRFILPSLGYRYANIKKGGAFFAVNIYPVYNNSRGYSFLARLPFDQLRLYDMTLVPWIGISLGYTFKATRDKCKKIP